MADTSGSQALKGQLTAGEHVVEFFGEVWSETQRLATFEIVDGSIEQGLEEGSFQSASVSIPITALGGGGLIPENESDGNNRLWGDLNFGAGQYGDRLVDYLRGLLLPLKSRIRLYARYYWDTDTETVLLGSYIVSEVDFNDSPSGITANVQARDVSFLIDQARIEAPVIILPSSSVRQAILNVLNPYMPSDVSATIPEGDGSAPLPNLILLPGSNDSPLRIATQLCDSQGWRLYVDRRNNIQVDTDPSRLGVQQLFWSFSDDQNLLSASLIPDQDGFANKIILTSENATSTPTTVVVEDDYSPFGTQSSGLGVSITRVESVDFVSNSAGALNVAQRMLTRSAGFAQKLEVETFQNPLLDAGDRVGITELELAYDDSLLIIDSISTSLGVNGTTRLTTVRRPLI